MIICVEVYLKDSEAGAYVVLPEDINWLLEDLDKSIKEKSLSDEWRIRLIEMSEEDFYLLDEYEGHNINE